jgi:type VI secretion system protein ImpF
MPRSQGDISVTLSVLDRLLDQEPRIEVEAPLSRAQSVRMLKGAVRRDLEWLLNSRRIFQEPDESLREVNRSVYVYGLPDFSAYSMASSGDQTKLLRHLLAAIKLFEPRLANVRIVPLQNSAFGFQEFKLRIEGLLLMDPAPEPVSFDTVIELRSGVCRITGATNAG